MGLRSRVLYAESSRIAGSNHDAFVLRLPKRLRYTQDQTVPAGSGVDAEGRTYEESWGWVGTVAKPQRFRIRRIKLELAEIADGSAAPPADSVIVITNLDDADQYPAVDLLEIYRHRWQIEQVFQSATEVFGLRHLIGSSRKRRASFSYCTTISTRLDMHSSGQVPCWGYIYLIVVNRGCPRYRSGEAQGLKLREG